MVVAVQATNSKAVANENLAENFLADFAWVLVQNRQVCCGLVVRLVVQPHVVSCRRMDLQPIITIVGETQVHVKRDSVKYNN